MIYGSGALFYVQLKFIFSLTVFSCLPKHPQGCKIFSQFPLHTFNKHSLSNKVNVFLFFFSSRPLLFFALYSLAPHPTSLHTKPHHQGLCFLLFFFFFFFEKQIAKRIMKNTKQKLRNINELIYIYIYIYIYYCTCQFNIMVFFFFCKTNCREDYSVIQIHFFCFPRGK